MVRALASQRTAKERAWKKAYDREYKARRENRGTCLHCGEPMGAGTTHDGICMPCRKQVQEDRWVLIEALWEDGLTMRQIAEETGQSFVTTNSEITRMRRAGRFVPFRQLRKRKSSLNGKR